MITVDMTVDHHHAPTRSEKARDIVWKKGAMKRIDDSSYSIQSQSGSGNYLVVKVPDGWTCQCPDYTYRHAKCKHILAVEISLELRRKVQSYNTTIAPITTLVCRFCQSENIVKDGIRHNKRGDIQKYTCKACGHHFTVNIGFEKMHATPQMITSAMQLYFSGESLRNVQKFLALQGLQVSHVAVLKWIRKYLGLMDGYLEKIVPNVSDTWRTDEISPLSFSERRTQLKTSTRGGNPHYQ